MPRVIDAEHAEPVIRAMVGAAGRRRRTDRRSSSRSSARWRSATSRSTSIPRRSSPLSPEGIGRGVRRAGAAPPGARAPGAGRAVPPSRSAATQMARVEEYCAALGEPGRGSPSSGTSWSGAGPRPRRTTCGSSRRSDTEPDARARSSASSTPGPCVGARSGARATGCWALADAGPGHPRPRVRRVLRAQRLRSARDRAAHAGGLRLARHVPRDRRATSRSRSTRSRSARCRSAIADTDTHWLQLLGNLGRARGAATSTARARSSRRRAGSPARARRRPSRTRSGAARSARATSRPIDHLALAHEPLADVRAAFGIPARTC